ncbi:MAG TPA: NUDIX hydrolase [Candidatus Moranbacteria bacterium]|nr:MAG: ADP-ribose pyrophosphatase [Candidatus Moranbacteria bacterium GW2011_GWF1_34_10]HBI16775.1 NUDIX hydrolase [Candidatus Moranbacteria bacterium]
MKIQNTKSKSKLIIGPAVAVDTLIFAIREGKLCVLLIQIGGGPYENKWALPGGIVQVDETLDQAAKNILNKKAGIEGLHMEQLYTFSDLNRDVRGRMVSVAYFALVDSDKLKPKTIDYYKAIEWREIDQLPALAFDHKKMINYGVERLRAKIEYSNIVYALLPKEFTLTEMQMVYEAIAGNKIDKRNFRKKIFSLELLIETNKERKGQKNRPAKLYRFKKRELMFTA